MTKPSDWALSRLAPFRRNIDKKYRDAVALLLDEVRTETISEVLGVFESSDTGTLREGLYKEGWDQALDAAKYAIGKLEPSAEIPPKRALQALRAFFAGAVNPDLHPEDGFQLFGDLSAEDKATVMRYAKELLEVSAEERAVRVQLIRLLAGAHRILRVSITVPEHDPKIAEIAAALDALAQEDAHGQK